MSALPGGRVVYMWPGGEQLPIQPSGNGPVEQDVPSHYSSADSATTYKVNFSLLQNHYSAL